MDSEIEKDFKIKKILGQGSYGKVLLVYRQSNPKEKFALKIINKGSFLDSEIEMLMELAKIKNYERYFPKIYNKYNYKNSIGILMEYVQGQDLYKIFEKKTKLDNREILDIAEEILKGLKLLNKNGIAHRDIKDENIILSKKKIKIVDFGFSCYYKLSLESKLACSEIKGTKLFMAPEVVRGDILKNPSLYQYSDVWAVGIIIWELIILKDPPIIEDIYPDIQSKTKYNPDEIRELYKKKIKKLKAPNPVKCFILACLEPIPENRPSASDLLILLRNVKEMI